MSSCEFWGKGQICRADEISVNNNTISMLGTMASVITEDTEFAAEMVGDVEEEPARTSRQTQCETMRPRHENR